MGKAMSPMDFCWGKEYTTSYNTAGNVINSVTTINIPSDVNDPEFTTMPNLKLFSYDINYNMDQKTASITNNSYITINVNPSSEFLFNKFLLRIKGLPNVVYTGSSTSISLRLRVRINTTQIVLRTFTFNVGQTINLNEGENEFLIDLVNLKLLSNDEKYHIIVPKNWKNPMPISKTLINNANTNVNPNFVIIIPRQFPNYIAAEVNYSLLYRNEAGMSVIVYTTQTTTTWELVFEDDDLGVASEIPEYFRFLKLTVSGGPRLSNTASFNKLFTLQLKNNNTSYTLLTTTVNVGETGTFDGTYYIDLKTMTLIDEQLFNKALII